MQYSHTNTIFVKPNRNNMFLLINIVEFDILEYNKCSKTYIRLKMTAILYKTNVIVQLVLKCTKLILKLIVHNI